MKSIIFEFVWNDMLCRSSIGSYEYYSRIIRSDVCRQLVRVVWLDHTEKDWDYIINLSEDELLFALTKFFKDNELYTIRPN